MQTAQRGAGEITPSDTYRQVRGVPARRLDGRLHPRERPRPAALGRAHAWRIPPTTRTGRATRSIPVLVARPSKVPTLWTQGLWDQEDMWGANHAWRALKAAGHEANNWLVLGPWNHVQVSAGGTSLGPMKWETNTTVEYQREILLPFLDEHLRGRAARQARPRRPCTTRARSAGSGSRPGRPRASRAAPPDCTPLYLSAGFGLSFDAPTRRRGGDTYISDPAKPVPFLPRPVVDPFGGLSGGRTGQLLRAVEQVAGARSALRRRASRRAHVRDAGADRAGARAGQSRSPTSAPRRPAPMATSSSSSSMCIRPLDAVDPRVERLPDADRTGHLPRPLPRELRASERASRRTSRRAVRFELPNVNHVFQPGHRIMVQIQSTLFPAVRPQSADVRAQHLQREAGGLSQGGYHDPAFEGSAVLRAVARRQVREPTC